MNPDHDPESPLLDHDHKSLASSEVCGRCHLTKQPLSPQDECAFNGNHVHHSPTDACCGNFCPDIKAQHEHSCCGGGCRHHHDHPWPRQRHRRDSHLSQQWLEVVEEEKAKGEKDEEGA